MEYRKSIDSTWKKCNKQRLKEKELTIPGLAEATEYEFRVFAENQTGMSRPRRTATCIKTKLSGEYIEIHRGNFFFFVDIHLTNSLRVVFIM